MTSRDSRDFSGQFSSLMPKVVIPMRRASTFLRALWLLAALVLVGVVYSFWRISRVPTPSLDAPPAPQPAAGPANSQAT